MLSIIDHSLLLAHPLTTGGFSFTMPTRLLEMLEMAEEKFGKRDSSFTILGIEFRQGVPQTWFPNYEKGLRHYVVVQLDMTTMQEPIRAFYQLAHETVHLLNPVPGEKASNLEEGLATWFSEKYIKERLSVDWIHCNDINYKKAMELVENHLINIYGESIIRDLRNKDSLSKLSSTIIKQACAGIKQNIADVLANKFPDGLSQI